MQIVYLQEEHQIGCKLRPMPAPRPDQIAPVPGWFQRLPKRLQTILLLLFTLGAGAILFFMGLHSVNTGEDIVFITVHVTAVESFCWSAAWFVISGGLFAVLMGWAKSSKE